MKRIPFFAALLCMMAFGFPSTKKLQVFLVGDSTVSNYEAVRSPLAGWGMPFAGFFDSTVIVQNKARGGRSTRTFISEGRWQQVSDSLSEGDYVLMQFGHNDEAKEEQYKDRYTPVPDYKKNLLKFIEETRAKKANPIIITPVTRMRFDKEGRQVETHKEYTAACYEIAKQTGAPLIDLDAKSRALLQRLGPEQSRLLFMYLEKGENPHYPEGQKDNTHFNDYGARLIAQLVLQGLRELQIPLTEHEVKPLRK